MTEFKRGDRVSLKNNIWYVHRAFTALLYVGDQPTEQESFITFPIQSDGVALHRNITTFRGNDYEWYDWDDFEAEQINNLTE